MDRTTDEGSDEGDWASRETSQKRMGRRQWLSAISALGIGTLAFQRSLAAQAAEANALTREMIAQAVWIAEIELSESEQDQLLKSMESVVEGQRAVRKIPIDADVPPALFFLPHFWIDRNQDLQPTAERRASPASTPKVTEELPTDEQFAFMSIAEQGAWLRSGKVTSVKLTQIYLDRMKLYDEVLEAIVTRLDDHALELAAAADKEMSEGKDRGPLHGIPWGAKDLIAVPPWKTTWGAEPYREQVRPQLATVADRLNRSGAVLLAKTSLGALAWGEKWFGGFTKNPWNIEQGSSGSSAGSAACVAAGLVGFAIGSETLGSIISPSRRCLVTGLRPSFGRVSRAGCMPLAWSLDKIGPMARTAEDCALVLAAICGPDGRDATVVDKPFVWPPAVDPKQIRVGFIQGQISAGEQAVLDKLSALGATIQPIVLPSRFPLNAMISTLSIEAAASFDDLLRSGQTAELGPWPPTFREGQMIPAVHYVRCSRLRSEAIQETEKVLTEVDVLVGGDDLVLTNLTGHPSMIVTTGTRESDRGARPWPVKLTSRYWGEEKMLLVAYWIQKELPPSPGKPDMAKIAPK